MITDIWKRVMLRGTSFSGSYGKLRGLYLQNDPWDMASTKEQFRFAETNVRLAGIDAQYESILELGCGEGHQSEHLVRLTDNLYGLDVSHKAVERAKKRCPNAKFATATLEQLDQAFPNIRFDTITACEVLYYLSDIPAALQLLQSKTDLIFISNYSERAAHMHHHFKGAGWHDLEDIVSDGTVWNCCYWQRPSA